MGDVKDSGSELGASGSCGRHREAVEDMWETRKESEGVQEVRERSGRPWESAEEAGRHGK